MVAHTKVVSSRTRLAVEELIGGLMVKCMLESGLKVRCTAKVTSNGKTAHESTKVSSKTI